MGWAVGYDHTHHRDIGYGVPAICDHPDCNEEIDRGLPYVCGSDVYGGEHGCGLFFCGIHRHLLEVEGERNYVSLCDQCKHDETKPAFEPKPDTKKWRIWKRTDESWAKWREENPVLAAAL